MQSANLAVNLIGLSSATETVRRNSLVEEDWPVVLVDSIGLYQTVRCIAIK